MPVVTEETIPSKDMAVEFIEIHLSFDPADTVEVTRNGEGPTYLGKAVRLP
jgi:hypothetical protein